MAGIGVEGCQSGVGPVRIAHPWAKKLCREGRRDMPIGARPVRTAGAPDAPANYCSSVAEADVSNGLGNSRVQVYCLDEHSPTAR